MVKDADSRLGLVALAAEALTPALSRFAGEGARRERGDRRRVGYSSSEGCTMPTGTRSGSSRQTT